MARGSQKFERGKIWTVMVVNYIINPYLCLCGLQKFGLNWCMISFSSQNALVERLSRTGYRNKSLLPSKT